MRTLTVNDRRVVLDFLAQQGWEEPVLNGLDDDGLVGLAQQVNDFSETDGFGDDPDKWNHGLDGVPLLPPDQRIDAIADGRSRYNDYDEDKGTTGDNRYASSQGFRGTGRGRGGQNWGSDSPPKDDGLVAYDRPANNELTLTYNGSSEPDGSLLLSPTMHFVANRKPCGCSGKTRHDDDVLLPSMF